MTGFVIDSVLSPIHSCFSPFLEHSKIYG
jgi:hypothetical protein